MVSPAALQTLITIGVNVLGAKDVDELKGKIFSLQGVVKKAGQVFANVGKKAASFGLDKIFKPPGLEASALFKIARGINTLAANIRFFQITLMMFIGGNIVKRFVDSFITMNAEIQSATLSLQAIIEAQNEIKIKNREGLGANSFLSVNLQKEMLDISREQTETLSNYATALAIRTGGEMDDMIRAARGIQVNTRDVTQTKRLLNVASQLALLDPVQGMAGATFSIRELMQGEGSRDFRSLAQRFEITFSKEFKKKFSASVKSGEIKKAIDLLKEELEAKGITDKILKNLEKSWILTMDVIKRYSQLALAKMGDPFFKYLNKYFYKISSLFISEQEKLFNKPGFKIASTSLSSILIEYVGKPIVQGFDYLKNYFLGVFTDIKFWDYISGVLSQGQKIFKQLVDIITPLVNKLFETLGVKDEKGDLLKGFINFIGLLVNRISEFLTQFVELGGLDLIEKYIVKWGEYYNTLFSDDNIKSMVRFMNIAIIFRTMWLEIHNALVKVMIVLSPLLELLTNFANKIYGLVKYDLANNARKFIIPGFNTFDVLNFVNKSLGANAPDAWSILEGNDTMKHPYYTKKLKSEFESDKKKILSDSSLTKDEKDSFLANLRNEYKQRKRDISKDFNIQTSSRKERAIIKEAMQELKNEKAFESIIKEASENKKLSKEMVDVLKDFLNNYQNNQKYNVTSTPSDQSILPFGVE